MCDLDILEVIEGSVVTVTALDTSCKLNATVFFHDGDWYYDEKAECDPNHQGSNWTIVADEDFIIGDSEPIGHNDHTPMPGLYRIRDLIEESNVNPIRKNRGIKGTDREHQPMGLKTEEVQMRQAMASSSFKTRPRPDVVTQGIRDKRNQWRRCPASKHLTHKSQWCELQSVSSPNFSFLLSFPSPSTKIEEKSPFCSFVFSVLSVHPCSFFFFYDSPIIHFLLRRHAIFRSSVQRIPFPPKEGPAPGAYTLSSKPADGITSCFKSKLPRLHTVHSVTPGPGAYEPHWKWVDNLTTVDPSFSLLFRNTP
ncbi:protein STPG4 [Hippocampus zosterae]|uniref:protein STPG4 n=1 Tax=Hippocampus zosterae TaxID=109293 RepID=UPI00223CB3E2|nr:protein STPG4 [Hippocampus zosterae]